MKKYKLIYSYCKWMDGYNYFVCKRIWKFYIPMYKEHDALIMGRLHTLASYTSTDFSEVKKFNKLYGLMDIMQVNRPHWYFFEKDKNNVFELDFDDYSEVFDKFAEYMI